LNLLKNAKGMCDKLIVGVTVDELVQYKGKNAMIPFEDRIEIVRSCKYVDAAVPQYDMDKLKAEFPSDFQERIERLSCYKESTGKSYKNDLATIRNWARKDNKPQEEPTRYGGTYL
jgi:cytidyltransferase-like protein